MTPAESFKVTDELLVPVPALPRPSLGELQKDFPWILKIDRDTSPTTSGTIFLATIFGSHDGDYIDPEEYERRIAFIQPFLLGYQHWKWLQVHQDVHPAFKALVGKVYIHFSGIRVLGKMRLSPPVTLVGGCLRGKWKESWSPLGVTPQNRVALLLPVLVTSSAL